MDYIYRVLVGYDTASGTGWPLTPFRNTKVLCSPGYDTASGTGWPLTYKALEALHGNGLLRYRKRYGLAINDSDDIFLKESLLLRYRKRYGLAINKATSNDVA